MRLPCFLLLSVSFHSSEQAFALEWKEPSTRVERSVHWSGTMQMQVGKYTNVRSIYFQ